MSEADLPKYEDEVLRRISDYFQPGTIQSITTGDNEMSEELKPGMGHLLALMESLEIPHPEWWLSKPPEFLMECGKAITAQAKQATTRTPPEYRYKWESFSKLWTSVGHRLSEPYRPDAWMIFNAARELKEK